MIVNSTNWKKKQIYVIDAKTGKSKPVSEETDPRWVDGGFAGGLRFAVCLLHQ